MQLPGGFECREHSVFGLRTFKPALSGEEALGHVLTGPEAVKNRAASESPGTKPVMDGAGEVSRQVLAWCACRFVQRKISGT
jgi:hypothetical protein